MEGLSDSSYYFEIYQEIYDSFVKGDYLSAREKCEKALSNPNVPPNFYRLLGRIHLSLEEYEEAVKWFHVTLEKVDSGVEFKIIGYPDSKGEESSSLVAWTYHDLAFAYLKDGRYFNAEKYLKKAAQKIHSLRRLETEIWFRNDLGWLYFEQENYDQALLAYNQAIDLADELNRRDGYSHLYRGLVFYRKGVIERAKEDFEDALDIFERQSGSPDIKLAKASVLVNLGRVYLDENQFQRARDYLVRAKDIYEDPALKNHVDSLPPIRKNEERKNISALHNNLGLLLYDQGLIDPAKKEYEIALEFGESASVYNNLGNIYADKGQKELAQRMYRLALTKDPSSESAQANLGLLRGDAKPAPEDWWDWWFKSSEVKMQDKEGLQAGIIQWLRWIASPKRLLGLFLVFSLIFVLGIISYTLIQTETSKNIITIENTTADGMITTTLTMDILNELAVAAFILLVLLLPRIKSFSLGSMSVQIAERASDSEGAGSRKDS